VAAHRQFNGIGDHLARRQRGFHAGVPHGDAVGHCNGAEFARRGPDHRDATLDRLSLSHQGDIAGSRFVPAGRNADERLVDLLFGQTHGIVESAVRRALRTLGGVAAWQPRFQICLCVHFHSTGFLHAPSPTLPISITEDRNAAEVGFWFAIHRAYWSKNPMAKKRRARTVQCGMTKSSSAVAG
jgi:hypothetical protein